MDILTFQAVDMLLSAIIASLFFFQLYFYLRVYKNIYKNSKKEEANKPNSDGSLPPLSVIIYTKDDAEHLKQFLPAVLEQDYPKFEVIVVDDSSQDNTEYLLEDFSRKYDNFYSSFTPDTLKNISHKKLSLTIGIKASRYDWVVFIESNCKPSSNQWLKHIGQKTSPKTDVVLGASIYEFKKGWKNRKISFDLLFTTMRYLGYAYIKQPYMGIGRNLAYRKELFFKQKGFSKHLHIERGDDDILINNIAKKENTAILTHQEAITIIHPKDIKQEWKKDRINYAITSKFYKNKTIYKLGFETCTALLFHATAVASIGYSILSKHYITGAIALAFWLTRWGVEMFVVNKNCKALTIKQRFYTTLPIFDFLLPIERMKFKIYRKLYKKRKDYFNQWI